MPDASGNNGHIPVLRRAVIDLLAPQPGQSVLDATLGLGGHSEAFLEAIAPDGTLTALDADRENLEKARSRLSRFGDRATLHGMNFRDAGSLPPLSFDIVFADLGVSSPHFDDPERGFTFRADAPLDLRFDRSTGRTATELLLSESEERIAEVLRDFGELQRSRALARTLVAHFRSEARHLSAWRTTDVVACVEKVFTYRAPRVLPQVFQALRIAVNDELGALKALLDALPVLLRPGGRAGIISYHSLEDRLTKQTFRALTTPVLDERTGHIAQAAGWELLTRKPVSPPADELEKNPRSRSARLRVLHRS